MVWLYFGSLFLFVCDIAAQLCRPHEALTCPNQEVLVDRMQLLAVEDLQQQCRKHHAYFECMKKFVGNCDALSRLRWEPLRDQTSYICGSGKTVYSSHAECWTNSTKNKLVVCNLNFQDDFASKPCGALTNFVSCSQATVKVGCDEGAGEVLRHMANLYVYPMQRAFRCNIVQESEITTTTTSSKSSSEYVNVTETVTADTSDTSVIPVTSTSASTTTKRSSGNRLHDRAWTFQVILVVNTCSAFLHLVYAR